MPALLAFLTAILQSKKPHIFAIVLTILLTLAYYVFANINERVTTLEFSDQSTCQKLDSMNGTLIRIENNVGITQKEVSDLKTALISRK